MNWAVYEFPWGTAVRNQNTGEWTNIYKSPNAEEIVVEGLDVILTDEGVIIGDLQNR